MKNHYETICVYCGEKFWRHNRNNLKIKVKSSKKKGKAIKNEFCSLECSAKHKTTKKIVTCSWCNKKFKKKLGEIAKSKSGLSFCDKSCSASFNNTRKRKSKRSKCEIMLFELIERKYKDLKLIPNDKEMLSGFEVDIAIPSLNLAIEWNGIVHYKPIYGDDKFSKIQKIDFKKQQIAEEKKIRFIVVPDLVSTEAYVREAFVNISKIIDELIDN